MAESFFVATGTKQQQYNSLLPQVMAVMDADAISNMANICAMLKAQFSWLWVGFYLVKENELVVGPYQGPLACTRIQKGKGVCGTAWASEKSIIVPDVNLFDGHIACSNISQSEIVIPVFSNGKIVAIFDADSEQKNCFDETDQEGLEKMMLFFKGSGLW